MQGRMIDLAHEVAGELGTTENEQVWVVVKALAKAYDAGRLAGHQEHAREEKGQCPLCGDTL